MTPAWVERRPKKLVGGKLVDVQQDIPKIGQTTRMEIEAGETTTPTHEEVEESEESPGQEQFMSVARWEREMAYMNRRWDRIEQRQTDQVAIFNTNLGYQVDYILARQLWCMGIGGISNNLEPQPPQ